jgi:hypothetical protein
VVVEVETVMLTVVPEDLEVALVGLLLVAHRPRQSDLEMRADHLPAAILMAGAGVEAVVRRRLGRMLSTIV